MNKNKRIIQILLPIALLVMAGCTKQTLMTYDQTASGSSIYFSQRTLTGVPITEQDIAFGYVPANIIDSVITLPVRVTGSPSDSDRVFALQMADTSTMQEGVDYDFYEQPVIKAGTISSSVKIIIHRTDALRDSTKNFHLNMQLVPNENFNIDIPYVYASNDTLSILHYSITTSDWAGQSYLWTDSRYRSASANLFGVYSVKKVQLMMAVLNLPASFFFPANPAAEPAIPTTLFSGWASYMKAWLAAEKLAGNIHYDENGKEITMGTAAT